MKNNSQFPAAGSTLVRRYGTALLAASGVMAVRVALMPLLGTRPPYITFYLGTVIAAAYGGMGPSLLVTFIGVAFGFFGNVLDGEKNHLHLVDAPRIEKHRVAAEDFERMLDQEIVERLVLRKDILQQFT